MFGLKSEFCLTESYNITNLTHRFHVVYFTVGASCSNERTHDTELISHESPALCQQHCQSGGQPRTRRLRQHHEDEGGADGRRVCGLQQRRGRERGITHLCSY